LPESAVYVTQDLV